MTHDKTTGLDPNVLGATTRTEAKIIEAAIDRLGWDEINAFNAQLKKGQSVTEDAGGYFLRCIKALFGIKRDPVLTYQDAARELFKAALQSKREAE